MELKLLRKIPFLATLSQANLKRIYKIAVAREYGEGQAIFTKSEPADSLFIVISGRVKIFTRSSSKKRKTFAYLNRGDFFGEMALIEDQPRSASAEAVTPSRLLMIRKSDFKKTLMSDPKLMFYLLQIMCARMRRANAEIEGLLFQNILGRVSKALTTLCRDGERSGRGVLLAEKFTQQELADLIGTTREPLTRALSALRRAELIDVRQGRYFIKDTDRLSALSLAAS
jgi:CRP-like cAMP-binding protein